MRPAGLCRLEAGCGFVIISPRVDDPMTIRGGRNRHQDRANLGRGRVIACQHRRRHADAPRRPAPHGWSEAAGVAAGRGLRLAGSPYKGANAPGPCGRTPGQGFRLAPRPAVPEAPRLDRLDRAADPLACPLGMAARMARVRRPAMTALGPGRGQDCLPRGAWCPVTDGADAPSPASPADRSSRSRNPREMDLTIAPPPTAGISWPR